ncbi:GNAT family N-acetyltransferase [Sphingomonas sp.]
MIETERLILRGWRDDDRMPFAAICRDPRVMTYLGPPQSDAEVRAAINRQRASQARAGHCFWAMERRKDGCFIGFCGLQAGAGNTPIAGEIEIGWRLAHPAWGMGYAREAAQASLDWGWRHLPVDAIVAITVPGNRRSWGLMERLGMQRAIGEDFDHPALPPDSHLRRHIVYRAMRPVPTGGN